MSREELTETVLQLEKRLMNNDGLFSAGQTGVYLGGKLVLTVWGVMPEVDSTREEGESWLSMRRRTEDLRKAYDKHKADLAEDIAEYLNSSKGLEVLEEKK